MFFMENWRKLSQTNHQIFLLNSSSEIDISPCRHVVGSHLNQLGKVLLLSTRNISYHGEIIRKKKSGCPSCLELYMLDLVDLVGLFIMFSLNNYFKHIYHME